MTNQEHKLIWMEQAVDLYINDLVPDDLTQN